MEKVSVHEILLKRGKWTSSEKLVKLVANKRGITQRQAYTLIKKACDSKEIKKHVFHDRTVIYGLEEFGPPSYAYKPEITSEAQLPWLRDKDMRGE